MKQRDSAGRAALILATTIWGASFVLAKIALQELPVAHVVLYRFLFSVLPILPFLLASRHKPRRGDLPIYMLTGVLMVPVTIFLQFEGLARSSATSTALMIGTGAPILAIAAVLFEGERLGRRGWTAIFASTVGVLLIVGLPGQSHHGLGSFLVFVSMWVSAVWVITSKRLTERYPAFHATGWILVFGTLFLIPITLIRSGWPTLSLSATTWASLLGLGPGCTVVAYVAWNWGISRVGTGRAGVYLNLEPVAGALLGIVCLGDPLTAGIVAGGAFILGAAIMISNPSKQLSEKDQGLRATCRSTSSALAA